MVEKIIFVGGDYPKEYFNLWHDSKFYSEFLEKYTDKLSLDGCGEMEFLYSDLEEYRNKLDKKKDKDLIKQINEILKDAKKLGNEYILFHCF